MKAKCKIYIALFLCICALPSAGLLFGGMEESMENRDTAQAPVLFTETGVNVAFLRDAGAWFEDHFAFRNEWVTGHALLMGKLFHVSSQESVITGKDGWLFYRDSLEDFQGAELLSERKLFHVAHSMAMIQRYAQENGIKFVFTIAPNKNSLYGEYMPYYYQAFRSGESNLGRLQKYLDSEGVNYVDLYGLLKNQAGRCLYHKRDSHWNNEGAALASDAVLSCLEKEHLSYAGRQYSIRKDFEGDLDKMLYPAAVTPEEEIYYDPTPQFAYVEEVESNFAPKIATVSSGGGSLVMYRDSFGNALLPYMAEAYGDAYFSRGLPYHLSDLREHGADTLVIERAERFLPDMACEAPIMEAPAVDHAIPDDAEALEVSDPEISEQDGLTQIRGRIPLGEHEIETEARIIVKVNGAACYEAFPIAYEDGQEGFSLCLPVGALAADGNKFELYLVEQEVM